MTKFFSPFEEYRNMEKVKLVGVMEKAIREGEIEGIDPSVVAGLLMTPLALAKRGENGTGRGSGESGGAKR